MNLTELKAKHKQIEKDIELLEYTLKDYNELKPIHEFVVPKINGLFDETPTWLEKDLQHFMNIKIYGTDETMNHDDSLKWAADRNMRLMTKEELNLLCACGFLKEGMKSVWSSSVVSNSRVYAWVFLGSYGYISDDYRDSCYGVRCVGRP